MNTDVRSQKSEVVALSRRWWSMEILGVTRMTLDWTPADRALRLRGRALEYLQRGNGPMARMLAGAAREIRRAHFANTAAGSAPLHGRAAV